MDCDNCDNCEIANCDCEQNTISQITQLDFGPILQPWDIDSLFWAFSRPLDALIKEGLI